MPKIRNECLPLPVGMLGRHIDHRGFPVPWFVTRKTENGEWDFVNIESERFNTAIRSRLCWVTGTPLGRHHAFVIGPMCVVNQVSGDPPVKRDIAVWSSNVCPFLSRPLSKRPVNRNEGDQRGLMVMENPGINAVYVVKAGSYKIKDGLFHLPEPESLEWYTKGRPATLDEVLEAVGRGIYRLEEMASQEGAEALKLLNKYKDRALKIIVEKYK